MKSMKNKKDIKIRTGRGKTRKAFKFKSRVFVWNAGNVERKDDSSQWRFARVPENISKEIKEMQKGRLRRGWGAVYAGVKVGKTKWTTSVFPDRRSETYILPLKKSVRYEENLYDGIDIKIELEVWF